MGAARRENPFEVTKAVDFTDREIKATFVDLPSSEGGFGAVLDPRSPMPHFLTGGKGGGRTHLMRHLSYSLQTIDAPSKFDRVVADGYVGVYFRCSGLNASRFGGKGLEPESWSSLFAYYLDLWLARLLLEVLHDMERSPGHPWTSRQLEELRKAVRWVFTDMLPSSPEHEQQGALAQLLAEVSQEIRILDRAINNAALRRPLDVNIKAGPGVGLFALVDQATRYLVPGVRVAFLIDELENLKEYQQRYINTLVREKSETCTFVVGSRAEGLRTFETLSAGEVNRAGSEFELTTLEDVYRSNPGAFRRFCTEVALARLREVHPTVDAEGLKRLFPGPPAQPNGGFTEADAHLRPHVQNLDKALRSALGGSRAVARIVELLSVEEDPLEEKLRILKFYQSWSGGTSPSEHLAASIRAEFLAEEGTETARRIGEFWKHHKADMIAQLYVESGQKVPYAGFNQFVEMSGYLPRSLLVILKNTVRWSQFLGETPLAAGGGVSVRAQTEGARDAAEWFLSDRLPSDATGASSGIAVRRLGGILRRMRFADKPVEVGCASFSSDHNGLTERALNSLKACVATGLIIHISAGQIDRNSGTFHHKYQLNPMVAPYFDLPTARRGVAKFNATEMNAIFDCQVEDHAFDGVVAERLRLMNAPFVSAISGQGALFD